MYQYNQGAPMQRDMATIGQRMWGVYAWMAGGLMLTAAAAYGVLLNPSFLQYLASHQYILFALFGLQFALVIGFSVYLTRMSFEAAAACFILYSALTGISLSFIFLVYTAASIVTTFLVAAGMFGTMACYGYATKADLSGLRPILTMGVIGLIIAGLVNMFMQNEMFDLVTSAFGVVIFTLLTAVDVQKIKELMNSPEIGSEMQAKVTLLGALMLYLDFINIFLYLLRFLGKKRD